MFPQSEDPKGDPQKWTEAEMRQWLNNVGLRLLLGVLFNAWLFAKLLLQSNLQSTGKETREELLARVEANMRAPRA